MVRTALLTFVATVVVFNTVTVVANPTSLEQLATHTSADPIAEYDRLQNYSFESGSSIPPLKLADSACCRDCTASTFTKTINANSPPISDCNAFADFLASNQGTWPLETLAANQLFRLGGIGLCRLAVTISEALGNGEEVVIGNLDAMDIVRIAVTTLANPKTGKVGAAGTFKCAGTYKGQVNWVLDSWDVGSQ